MKNTREYNREYARRRREKSRENGICTYCCKRPASPGMKMCGRCLEIMREKNKLRYYALKAKRALLENEE